jgi:hypothetical protein
VKHRNKRHHRRDIFEHEHNTQTYKEKAWKREHDAGGFRCSHCKTWVVINDYIGTSNRNHCNYCLWSKHVDQEKGDRKAVCHNGMKPIALTFKHEGYGKQGEIMLVHQCQGADCEKISINRIARDDADREVLDIFELSKQVLSEQFLAETSITILGKHDEPEICKQLFGVESA